MDQDRRSPLLHEDWVYFDKPIRDFRGADWNVLESHLRRIGSMRQHCSSPNFQRKITGCLRTMETSSRILLT